MSVFRRPKFQSKLALALISATALVTPSVAANNSWLGVNSDWNDPINWSLGAPPTALDRAIFGTGNTSVQLGASQSATSLIFSQNNLAISSGTLSLAGGEILVAPGIVSTLDYFTTLNISGPYAVDVALAGVLNLDGAVSATSGIVKSGDGVLSVGYRLNGPVLVSDGTLNLGYAGGVPGSASISGVVDIAADGILATTGNGSRSIGSLSGSGNVNLSQALTIGTDNTNSAFSGVISGGGSLTKSGNGTLSLSGNNTLTGTTTITDGTLEITGGHGFSAVNVQGGTLAGTGTIGSVVVSSGAALAPGIVGGTTGQLPVINSVIFSAGSFYDVDVTDNQSDILTADSVDIQGGTVRVHAIAGSYQNTTVYDIIVANSITGSFSTATVDDLAFLTPSVVTNGDRVQLQLSRAVPVVPVSPVIPPTVTPPVLPTTPIAFNSVAQTGNQFTAANGIESVGGGELYNNIMVQTVEGARQAFDAISGEAFASEQSALLASSNSISISALDRAREGSNASSNGGAVMSYVDAGKGTALSAGDRTVWGGAYGGRSSIDGDGNAAGVKHSFGGFKAGADDWFGDFRLGAMLSAGRSSSNVDARNSSLDSNNYGVGIYGGTEFGDTGFALGAAYQRHDIDSSRNVVFPGFAQTLRGEYSAGTAQVFGEVGHKFDLGTIEIEPFAQAAYVNVQTDGFTETGGSAALTVDDASASALFTTIGVRTEGEFKLENDLTIVASGGIGWRHAFADNPASTASFAGGQTFAVNGAGVARNALVLKAGLGFAVTEEASLSFAYDGQFASSASDHTVQAKLSVKF